MEAKVRYHTARYDLMIAYFALLRAAGADLAAVYQQMESEHGHFK
jgi:hypothetical protein